MYTKSLTGLKNSKCQTIEPAIQDFQKFLFDPLTGNLVELNHYIESKNAKLDGNKREIFYNDLKRRLEPQKTVADSLHSVSITKLAIILRNRMLFFEHCEKNLPIDIFPKDTFPFTLYDENDAKYHVLYDKYSIDELLDHIRKEKSKGKYNIILVDEVQDLHPHFIVLLSFFNSDRINQEKYRLIISGDDLQTLNGTEFVWNDYFKFIKHFTDIIIEDLKHIYEPHHLFTLTELSKSGKLNEVIRIVRKSLIISTMQGFGQMSPMMRN